MVIVSKIPEGSSKWANIALFLKNDSFFKK
jgi:hypothetical protein